jgi:hypothetical protein
MELTAEQIAKHYSAAMDSVNFINELNAGEHDERMTAEEKADALSRNKVASLRNHACQRLLDDRGLATLP